MGQKIEIDPAALEQPANRFRAGAASLGQLGQVVRQVLQEAGGAAAHPVVVGAAETYGAATSAVLGAFGGECGQLAEKLAAAGVRYHVTDETALVVQLDSMGLQAPP